MTTYYVSTNGNDSNPGTQSQPFKTISKGINTSVNGDTVHVFAGTYYPTFSTRPIINKSISVIGDGKANTIIDGSSITQYTDGWQEGLVEIPGNNVLFQGFTVQNSVGGDSGCAGIVIIGNENTVERNLIQNTFDSGIKLYGNGSGSYATNNTIRYNELYNICTGLSVQEGLSIVETDTFEIYYNYIHKTGYTPSGGNVQYGGEGIDAKQYVNNGKIHHNYIYDARSTGMYVDGYSETAQNLEIYQNIVEKIYAFGGGPNSRGDGVSIGPESGGTNQNINFHDNISYNNASGMFICNAFSGGHNTNLTYNANIFYANDTDISYSGAGNCTSSLSGIVIENNYAVSIDSFPSGVTLSGNITDSIQVTNMFNSTYTNLKTDILTQVNSPGTTLVSIQISPASANVYVSKTIQLTAICTDTNNNMVTCPILAWSSSNASVAVVDSNGLVTGIAAGNTNITASASGIASNMTVITVIVPVVGSIQISPASSTINAGKTVQLTATCIDQNNNTMTCPTLTWNSDNAFAVVYNNGLVTGVSAGNVNITASSGNITSNASIITVTVPVLSSIQISPTNSTIVVGKTVQLTVICKDQNGNTMACPTLAWSSSNTSVATVDSTGLVTGVSAGNVNITTSSGNITSNTSAITVSPVVSVNMLLNPGFELSTKIVGMPDNWSKYPTTWSSTAKLTYPEVGNDGSKAVGISQTNKGYKQSLIQGIQNIVGSANYQISGYMNTTNVVGTYTAQGAIIGVDWFSPSGYISSSTINITRTNSWTYKSITATAPSNTVRANFFVGLFGTGKALFDNVSFKKL